jgi:hypothetical protein
VEEELCFYCYLFSQASIRGKAGLTTVTASAASSSNDVNAVDFIGPVWEIVRDVYSQKTSAGGSGWVEVKELETAVSMRIPFHELPFPGCITFRIQCRSTSCRD